VTLVRYRWLVLVAGAAILALGLWYYVQRIDTWQAYDDEGGYLYASWRISLGEVPYRDFLTPQLPGFLYPGALLLTVTDQSVRAVRIAMALITLASVGLSAWTAQRLWGWAVALVALPLLLVQPDIYWAGRFFRPEAFMLLWGSLGLWLLLEGRARRSGPLLALAGAAMGLAMMSKLFGALYLAGAGLFLLACLLGGEDWRAVGREALWLGGPFLLVVGLLTAIFLHYSPHFVADVLGHHLRQGSGTPFAEVLAKGLRLYRDFAVAQPLFLALAGLGVVTSLRWGRRDGWLMACMLPTALAFLLMSRDLQARHLTYLVPALGLLASQALVTGWRWLSGDGGWLRVALGGLVVGALVGLALWPMAVQNQWVASWEEHSTAEWTAYIQEHTAPDDVVVADYPGINFYARRPTTATAAGISRGAAASGQIMGADLIAEMEQSNATMVLLNVAQGAHQFVRLLDYPAFKQYVQTHYYLAERRPYDYRLLEVYARQDLWPGSPLQADAGHQLLLTGQHWLVDQARPGDALQVDLRVQSIAPVDDDYYVSLVLVDEAGFEWGLGSKDLVDLDKETYWDEKGLERAVRIPTSQWPVSEVTIETFELPVALCTPPGSYRVLARVHPHDRWAGLPLFGPEGEPLGYDLELSDHVTILPSERQVAPDELRLAERIETQVADDLLLVGHDLPEVQVRPGDRVRFSIYWEPTAAVPSDTGLELTLSQGGQTMAQNRYVLLGNHPAPDQWARGNTLRGQYELAVPSDVVTGDYDLTAQVLRGNQPSGAPVLLRQMRIEGRERTMELPALQQPLGAVFGDQVALAGYDLTMPEEPGGAISLVIHWQAMQTMATPWTVFVHVLGEGETIWGQADGQPLAGTYPMTAWLPGEVVSDAYPLTPKEGAPDGTYRLAIGLYDGLTGLRLTVTTIGQAEVSGDRVLLPPVHWSPR
jgi:hypothetical protein